MVNLTNLKSSKDGLIIPYYFNKIGGFNATVMPSSAELYTTLFIRVNKVCYTAVVFLLLLNFL